MGWFLGVVLKKRERFTMSASDEWPDMVDLELPAL